MKIRNILGVSALALAGLAFAACGGKDGDNKGGGGALSIDDRVASLEAEIAALKEALKTAAEDEIPALQAALKDAQDKLDALNTCANGGPCEGTESYAEVTALTDAYCEWAFNCCTDDEVRATLSAAAGDVEGCKDMYADMLFRGYVTPYMPGGPYWEGAIQAETAEALQAGRIEINSDAVTACAAMMSDASCGGEGVAVRAECGAEEEYACDDIFVGLQAEGESCNQYYYSGEFSECVEGTFCSQASPFVDGVCVAGAEEDDACQEDNDCDNFDGDLYCDESVGSCKVKPTVGETCVFEDPQFNTLSPNNLIVPCQGDSYCSMETSKCVSTCDSLKEGDLCNSSYSNYCGDDMYCDMNADTADLSYAGECVPKFAPGETPTGNNSSLCLSGGTYTDGTVKCDWFGGDDCSDVGGAQCDSGVCNFDDSCLTKCDDTYGDVDCGSGEHCVSDVCYPNVATNQDCFVDEQCADDEFCDGSCTAKGGVGDSCGDDDECLAGFSCDNYIGECLPVEGQGTGEECYDWYQCKSQRCDLDSNECLAPSSLGEGDNCTIASGDLDEINNDPCGAGFYCKQNNPNAASYDDSGKCTAQGKPGDVCNNVDSGRPVCVGNMECATSPATQKQTCRMAYTTPDEDEKCTLSTFSTYTGYAISGGGDNFD